MIPQALIEQMQSVERVVVLTGAGVSAESGIPTFRDAQTGIWAKFDPEELATRNAFAQNPERVWQWYAWRRELVAECVPNAGHFALAEIETKMRDFDFTLITQNVDGLHSRAGNQSLITLHGDIADYKCFDYNHPVPAKWVAAQPAEPAPPLCPECGSWVRPDVVWFGEGLNPADIGAAWEASERAQLFISAGTSSLVYPAAALPQVALRAGAIFVEINLAPTPLTNYAHHALVGASGQLLPQLLTAVWG